MAVIIKGIDKIEQSAGTNSLEWAWQNDGPADGEVLIFGENGQLTNGQPVAVGLGSSPNNAAASATELKATLGSNAINGAYWYTINGSAIQLLTDFETYSNYSMVLVTRLSSADHLQYQTTERNFEDLTVANITAPSRSAKLSDTDLNYIIETNTIRWVIVADKAIFYKMNDAWTSNFGKADDCNYTTTYYSQYATPSNTPSFMTFASTSHGGGCGGGRDANAKWLLLSGIHVNDPTHNGGYVGTSPNSGNAPSQYVTATDSGWNQPGYVFLSW